MKSWYSKKAGEIFPHYESVNAEKVHSAWLHLIPKNHSLILDVGAGSGRDASWFAEQGHEVIAVEPCDELKTLATEKHKSKSITWLNDSLPGLKKVRKLDYKFDVIVLSAVWMHVLPADRKRAFRVLANLLKPGGILVMSIRDGSIEADRGMYPVNLHQLSNFAVSNSLETVLDRLTSDSLGREEIFWGTYVYRLPDDGTGALPVLRNIVVNDNKSSTYKMALLRSLLRIADGARGAVLKNDDEYVHLPFGLVSLYWMRMYMPLILNNDYLQMPKQNSKLAFNKSSFQSLMNISPFDLHVGSCFDGPRAANIFQALKLCRDVIARMPAVFTTWPGTSKPLFLTEKLLISAPSSFCLDMDFLSAFGIFKVPCNVWEAMTRYACWVEPAVVKEWAAQIQRYHKGSGPITTDELNTALIWLDPERKTTEVRGIVDKLRKHGKGIYCVWTGSRLKSDFAVDHCFPFVHWPNNDLWNLMPAGVKINLQKSARLPSADMLFKARERMLNWWGEAYGDNVYQDRFMREADLALPLPGNAGGDEFVKVYGGMQGQRIRLKTDQQVEEWGI